MGAIEVHHAAASLGGRKGVERDKCYGQINPLIASHSLSG